MRAVIAAKVKVEGPVRRIVEFRYWRSSDKRRRAVPSASSVRDAKEIGPSPGRIAEVVLGCQERRRGKHSA